MAEMKLWMLCVMLIGVVHERGVAFPGVMCYESGFWS